MPGSITIVGLGPGDLARTPTDTQTLLTDPAVEVIVRTLAHPAAAELAARREIVGCDDLYDDAATFDDVYEAIADRVVAAATTRLVAYAVPGSPLVAERSVGLVRQKARRDRIPVSITHAPSFLDELWLALERDPAESGFQLLDGRDLPNPLPLHVPTVIFHIDLPVILADVAGRLARVIPDETPVIVVRDLGTQTASINTVPLQDLDPAMAGFRTSLFLEATPVGYLGALAAMRRLRRECPWDREQTHDSLVPFVLEEVSELVEALAALPPGAPAAQPADYGAYADVEDELGDLLLQVIFHANLAAEVGAFDMEDVAEQLRRKLVRRHPHVFGDVEVAGAAEVVQNWQAIKAEEKSAGTSLMGGIPAGMASLARAVKVQNRAARVGFDWPDVTAVLDKVSEELSELRQALGSAQAPEEIGDLLFSVVNAARLMGVEPDVALRRATGKFMDRFRRMESEGELEGLTIEELNERWDRAKQTPRAL